MSRHFDRDALWTLLRTVPRGRVVTYATLAERLGGKVDYLLSRIQEMGI